MALFSNHRSSQYHPKNGQSVAVTCTGNTDKQPYLRLTGEHAEPSGNSVVRSRRLPAYSKASITSSHSSTRLSADSTSKQTCASSHSQATAAKVTEAGPTCGASKASFSKLICDYLTGLLVGVGAMAAALGVALYQAGFFHHLANKSPDNWFLNFLFGA
ncbi:hypothetical protein [Curvibacter phage PCA1]|nr:hypothetical protein [Curvibacter phage PCA1]